MDTGTSAKAEYAGLFPDNRYSGTTTLRQAQLVMLRSLRIVDHICRKYGLLYWLHGGTLLGAVRHKGFVPWNDDLDIAMPRKDYERFVTIALRELPDDLLLQTPDTEKAYRPYKIPKIRDKFSRFIEDKETVPYCQGIFIDIYPFDSYPAEWIMSLLNLQHRLKIYRRRFPKGSPARVLCNLGLNTFGQPVIVSLKCIEWIAANCRDKFFNNEGDEFITYGTETARKPPFKKTEVYPLQELSFEGYTFYGPVNTDGYLKKIYGDYMTPPPEVDRKGSHARQIIIDSAGRGAFPQ